MMVKPSVDDLKQIEVEWPILAAEANVSEAVYQHSQSANPTTKRMLEQAKTDLAACWVERSATWYQLSNNVFLTEQERNPEWLFS